MKKFKVTFIKIQKVIAQQNNVMILAEQIIESESETITIPVPVGFQILTVTELLPDVTLKINGSKTTNNGN